MSVTLTKPGEPDAAWLEEFATDAVVDVGPLHELLARLWPADNADKEDAVWDADIVRTCCWAHPMEDPQLRMTLLGPYWDRLIICDFIGLWRYELRGDVIDMPYLKEMVATREGDAWRFEITFLGSDETITIGCREAHGEIRMLKAPIKRREHDATRNLR